MTALLTLALIAAGAWLARGLYRAGLTTGRQRGYQAGRRDAFAQARSLLTQRTTQLSGENDHA